jgi:hypothetical protein
VSVKSIAAPWPGVVEASPLARAVRDAARRLFRRFFASERCAERGLAVEERVGLGPRKALVVVRCHGQRFLVATSGDAVGPILEIAAPKPVRRARKGSDA